MKFTIGTVSSSPNLTEDLKLIKSSILYADEIELIGMMEYALYKYMPANVFGAKDLESIIPAWILFIESIHPEGGETMVQKLEYTQQQLKLFAPYLKKKKQRSKQEILAQRQMETVEKQIREQLANSMEEFFSAYGSQEIKNLIDRNIIPVYDYKFKKFDSNELTGGYFANLMNAMYTKAAYPLFDKQSSDIIDSVVKINLLDIGRLDNKVLRHAGIASEILMTLPTLESASVDELLDLKKENQVPLTNFRKAIYDFSNQIGSLPWDKDFQYDCLQLYNTEVVPKIQEINEVMTQTSVLKNLGSRILADEEIRKKAGYTIAGLTTVITTSTDVFCLIEGIKNLLLVGGLAAISKEFTTGFLKIANMYNQSRIEVNEKKDVAKKNVMYYYYLASKL